MSVVELATRLIPASLCIDLELCTLCGAGAWLALLGTSLPAAVNFSMNYIIVHALMTNVFRFVWCDIVPAAGRLLALTAVCSILPAGAGESTALPPVIHNLQASRRHSSFCSLPLVRPLP